MLPTFTMTARLMVVPLLRSSSRHRMNVPTQNLGRLPNKMALAQNVLIGKDQLLIDYGFHAFISHC